jgi:predicted phosphatase
MKVMKGNKFYAECILYFGYCCISHMPKTEIMLFNILLVVRSERETIWMPKTEVMLFNILLVVRSERETIWMPKTEVMLFNILLVVR